jgi:hypothetical protein
VIAAVVAGPAPCALDLSAPAALRRSVLDELLLRVEVVAQIEREVLRAEDLARRCAGQLSEQRPHSVHV